MIGGEGRASATVTHFERLQLCEFAFTRPDLAEAERSFDRLANAAARPDLAVTRLPEQRAMSARGQPQRLVAYRLSPLPPRPEQPEQTLLLSIIDDPRMPLPILMAYRVRWLNATP
jgi:hypothetical protein